MNEKARRQGYNSARPTPPVISEVVKTGIYGPIDPEYMHPYKPTEEERKATLEGMSKALEAWGKV